MDTTPSNFVFFGTSDFAVELLENLKQFGILPKLIVTTPDMPAGRNMTLTPPPVKLWADQNSINYIQPKSLKDSAVVDFLTSLHATYFLIAAYGKIVPENILSLPPKKTLNIHPSLLPRYRGPSPIQYQIIANEKHIGTSIMIIDEQIDHGPLLAQKEIPFPRQDDELIDSYEIVEKKLAEESALLFKETIFSWLANTLKPTEQDHSKATFTKMISKADCLIDLDHPNQAELYRKYLALTPKPGTYFMQHIKKDTPEERSIRVLIKKAAWKNKSFVLERVTPEGKKEMDYTDFVRGLR